MNKIISYLEENNRVEDSIKVKNLVESSGAETLEDLTLFIKANTECDKLDDEAIDKIYDFCDEYTSFAHKISKDIIPGLVIIRELKNEGITFE